MSYQIKEDAFDQPLNNSINENSIVSLKKGEKRGVRISLVKNQVSGNIPQTS